ncbi:MAG: glycoside hydrolase family 92 protein [Proteiniphilum sp.]|nr:glycoside hydrolase family 92 protein [Proteiniphilum sp.]
MYIRSIKLNGAPYHKSYITHSDIVNGGELVFEMSNKTNKKSSSYEKPYSFTK